jgi:hypothetical protein
MEKVKARRSFGEDYECKHPWTCFVQCGDDGVVFAGTDSYRTAFFEAFPKDPNCFVRGEGKNVEDAEDACWKKYEAIRSCKHDMERRNRTDGYGYCKHCSYSTMFFEPITRCRICDKPANYTQDSSGRTYCKPHSRMMPRKDRNKYDRHGRVPRKQKKAAKNLATAAFREHGLTERVYMRGKVYFRFVCGKYTIGFKKT